MVFFLAFLIAAAIFLQCNMGKASSEHLSCSLQAGAYLVEPGEAFSVTFRVENRSRFPVLFLRCSFTVPREAVCLPENRGELTCYAYSSRYRFRCFLMPRQRLEHTASFSIDRRGGYRFGELCLETGDFLGRKEHPAEYPGGCDVVILPRRPDSGVPKQVLGGLIGEHSVNRWIHEDPILSAGFREYTGREPMKTISWSRSLQSGRWMVRQMDHTAEEKVTVLLSMNSGSWEDREVCFRLCRGVCELLEEHRLPYAFLHNGMLLTSVGILPPVEAGLGSTHLGRILEGLGRAVPDVNGDLASLLRRAGARRQDCACCLLIVPGVTPEVRTRARNLELQTGGTVILISGEAET